MDEDLSSECLFSVFDHKHDHFGLELSMPNRQLEYSCVWIKATILNGQGRILVYKESGYLSNLNVLNDLIAS
jgi:hypothetical protein